MTIDHDPPRGAAPSLSAEAQAPLAAEPSQVADLVLAGAALILLIAYGPAMYLASVTVRSVVLWGLGGAGIVALVLLAATRDRAACWALGFLAWALISVLASGQARLSFFAAYGADRGWVFLASCLGCWALGRRRSRSGGRLLLIAIVVGLALNAMVAVVQMAGDGVGLFYVPDGRAAGFTDNPIFLGGLAAGGVAVGAAMAVRPGRTWWAWLALVGGSVALANLSGSRIGLVAGVVLGIGVAVRSDRRRAVAVGVAIVVGLGLSMALVRSDAGATSRIQGDGAGSGIAARSLMWRAGVDAVMDRPVLGWGPGRFRQATADRTGADYVRAEGPDRLYADAHNELVELLVTTGVPGLVLIGGFTWSVVAGDPRARGPLAWFSLAIMATWVLEPTSASTAPLALLALGYATAEDDAAPPPTSPTSRTVARAVAALAALIGLVLGARLVAADRDVLIAVEQASTDAADRAAARFPSDPLIADVRTRVLTQDALISKDPERQRAALAAAQRAVEIDPTEPTAWIRLGMARAAFGPGTAQEDLVSARRAFRQALEENPWSVLAMHELWRTERLLGHQAAAERWSARLCELDACPTP